MLSIDQYAYINRFRNEHPAEKLLFSILTMAICLISSSIPVCLLVIGLMAGVTVFGAGIPGRVYLKLLLVPAAFLLLSVLTIVISGGYNVQGDNWVYQVRLGAVTLGATHNNVWLGVSVFVKSLSMVSCLYFLSLTTPLVELVTVLRKCRLPEIVIELMGLIYRFIFLLLETVQKIRLSQSSRWGYANTRNSYRSLGQLVSSLFIKSMHRSQIMYNALESRGYTGHLNVLEPDFRFSRTNILIILLMEILLTLLAFKVWR